MKPNSTAPGMTYDVTRDGVVVAIRIFFDDDPNILAELAFAFGGKAIIDWTDVAQREKYAAGINAYTVFFDERFPNTTFAQFVR